MQAGFALLAGLLFGVGLIVSGMANPQKVLGFSTWRAAGIRRSRS